MSSLSRIAVGLAVALSPGTALAHVKWFVPFDLGQTPAPLASILQPTLFAIVALAVVVMGAAVIVDARLGDAPQMQRVERWLATFQPNAHLIMRVVMGAVLLLSWQSDRVLFPELIAPGSLLGWVLFGLAILLLFRRTVPIAGVALLAIYVWAISRFGLLHMLDYAVWPGAAVYLTLHEHRRPRLAGLALPALYMGVGFGLCWVAMEKLVYPQWALEILTSKPLLTMGLPPSLFVVGAALVEFCLGYLLIICLLERPTALVVTLVFFSTTLLFGKTEVIGHTLIHGALVVFVLEGPGVVYPSPIRFHEKASLRVAFAAVNLLVWLTLILGGYHYAATAEATAAVTAGAVHQHGPVAAQDPVPTLNAVVSPDAMGGWNLRLDTRHFEFAPEEAGRPHRPGAGHAHVYVDGRKFARMYGRWLHIPALPPGDHTLRVTLNANDHRTYHSKEQPIQVESTFR